MSIPTFTVTPSSLRPLTFSQDMDQLLSELNPWVQALNEKGNAFALGLSATSATNLTLGTGIKTLSVQSGKGFVPGMDIVIASTATPTDRMLCTVTSYDVTTGALVADAYSSTGAGSASAWAISMTAAVDAAAFVTPDGTQVLTNKTLTSPVMTGTPTAPTAAPGTNTTQLSTTAFVQSALAALVASSPAALDTLNELAAALGNDANFAATVTNALALKAPLANPAFTGTPTVPTAAVDTDTTQAASTAFVQRLAAGRRRFTAQGAIDAGETVVLNGNGTVSPVGYSINPGAMGPEETPTISGNPVQLLDIPGTNSVVLLTDTHIHAGTVDGGTGTTTWGAGVALTGGYHRICWHPVANVVCMVYNTSSACHLVLGTVSGNTITLGTPLDIGAAAGTTTQARYGICHNAHQDKIVVIYNSTSSNVAVQAVHVAGGVMTAGSAASVSSSGGSGVHHFAIADAPGVPEVVVAYSRGSTLRGFRALTVNATALTARTEVTSSISSGGIQGTAWLEHVGAGKFVFVGPGSTEGAYQIVTLSGTTVSATTLAALSTPWSGGTVELAQQPMAYDIGKGELVFFGLENTTGYARTAPATISGSVLVFGSSTYINTSTTTKPVVGYSSEDKAVFAYVDAGNGNAKTTRVWDTGDSVTDANNWIGISAAAIANGAQGLVITKGGIATLSGLTTGYQYYIDDLGELQQTGSRRAGVALSATELFLTGNM